MRNENLEMSHQKSEMRFKLVVATRESEDNFYKKTATGRSILFNKPSTLELKLFANNTKGLPTVYNEAIKECVGNPATIIFAHDDLHILDYFWRSRVKEALSKFDIMGIAGNKRRLPMQPSWAVIDSKFTWDTSENLSGVVGHGKSFPPSKLNVYGRPGQRVKLLDGLLLAAESETLLKNNLFFDEKFDFHFYDLDFCRQAEERGLSCGTWDLSLIHESGGSFGSENWKIAYHKYLEKWKE
jgi:hypothetical protein